MNLVQLKHEWKRCTRCHLGEHAYRHVLWELPEGKPVDVLFVGEGPGEGEDQLGRPFIGRAGKLLRNTLAEIRVSDLGIAYSNLLACRPFSEEDGKNREPSPAEVETCIPRLAELIRLIKPSCIIALGRIPDAYLTREFLETCGFDGLYFSYYHPSYIVRQKGASLAQAKQEYRDQIAQFIRKIRAQKAQLTLKALVKR